MEVMYQMEKKNVKTNIGRPAGGGRNTTNRQRTQKVLKDEDTQKNGPHKAQEENRREKKKCPVWFLILVLAAVTAIVLFLLRGRGGDWKRLILDMPEYEDFIGYEDPDDEGGAEERMDLAVIPDFTVTKENPCFLIPYPDNAYDVEFSFLDENGTERYHTKRIRPGTVIQVPAYDFCDEGEHTYQIAVEAYDRDTYVRMEMAVVLEMKITKE